MLLFTSLEPDSKSKNMILKSRKYICAKELYYKTKQVLIRQMLSRKCSQYPCVSLLKIEQKAVCSQDMFFKF